MLYRGADLTFAWVHKGLLMFGTQAVFLGGLAVAGAMTLSAWRVVKEQAKLPDESKQ